jgi:hypothetical protein
MPLAATLKSWKRPGGILSVVKPKNEPELRHQVFAVIWHKSGGHAEGCAFFGLNLTKVLNLGPTKGYFRTLARDA